MALAAAIEPGWSTAVYVALLFGVVEPLTGYALEPLLYGHSTGLSPISVIVAALFWTWLWGPVGLIMSTPLTLCLVVTGRHVKSLAFFDVLLGDQPALTPLETFYQRLLTAQSDAMLVCAQAVLQKAALVTFYDEIVLPALQRAAKDRLSGRMDEERYQSVEAGMHTLIARLDPPGGTTTQPTRFILCIAATGPFDGIVAEISPRWYPRTGQRPSTALSENASGASVTNASVSAAILCQTEFDSNAPQFSMKMKKLTETFPRAAIAVGFGYTTQETNKIPIFSNFSNAIGSLVIRENP
jgi:hypothetical protein